MCKYVCYVSGSLKKTEITLDNSNRKIFKIRGWDKGKKF